jgi:hypothetical protein
MTARFFGFNRKNRAVIDRPYSKRGCKEWDLTRH